LAAAPPRCIHDHVSKDSQLFGCSLVVQHRQGGGRISQAKCLCVLEKRS
jgi:hypothetical protein